MIPTPAGVKMAGPKPNKVAKMVRERKLGAKEMARDDMVKCILPTKNKVLRPFTSAKRPALFP